MWCCECVSQWFQLWSQIRDFAKEENLGKDLKNKCQLREEGDQRALETKRTAEGAHRVQRSERRPEWLEPQGAKRWMMWDVLQGHSLQREGERGAREWEPMRLWSDSPPERFSGCTGENRLERMWGDSVLNMQNVFQLYCQDHNNPQASVGTLWNW